MLPFADEQAPEPPKIGALALVELVPLPVEPDVLDEPVVPEELDVPVVPVDPEVPVVPVVPEVPVVPVVPVDPVVRVTGPPEPVELPAEDPPVEPVVPADPSVEEPSPVRVEVPEPLPALRIASDDNLVPHPVITTKALAARQVALTHLDLDCDAVGSRLLSMDPPLGRSPADARQRRMFAVRDVDARVKMVIR